MKKRIMSIVLTLVLIVSISSTAFATEESNKSGALQAFHREAQAEISGYENEKLTRSYAVGTCFTGADIEKKFLKKQWRGSGEVSIVGGVTWDITINCDFYKDGHYYTGNDTTSTQTDSAYVATKYVSGNSKSQFGVHCQFTVIDDNGITIHDSQLSSGNPFN